MRFFDAEGLFRLIPLHILITQKTGTNPMKANWNARPSFSLLTALLLLFGIFLMAPGQATAQEGPDGRPAGATPTGPVAPEPAPNEPERLGPDGCDFDDCSEWKGREVEAQIDLGTPGVARMLTQSQSFQIQTGAPVNSVHISDNGNIGFGTQAPFGRIHVVAKPGDATTGDIFVLDENGNLELGGLLTEASSRLLKENFTLVDGTTVLETLAALPISTWNYKTDDASVRHMGPMAQDFYAAFGLGTDDEHIAPLDANGVAMAAIQALHQQEQAQAQRIATLEAQNAELLQRLEALEALIQK